MFVEITEYKVKKGKEDAFKSLIKEVIVEKRKSNGFSAVKIFKKIKADMHLLCAEWQSKECFENSKEDMEKYSKKLKELVDGNPKNTYYEVIVGEVVKKENKAK